MKLIIKYLQFSLISVSLLTVGSIILQTQKVTALTGSDFRAGRIIDDSVFYNGSTLDTTQIQNFLNSKVPVCDTNGTQPRGNTTRAAYGTSVGNPPPYICLKNYTENTPTKVADTYCNNTHIGGVKTAAQIINDIGIACGISQKAMIVLLEKEQSLITDDWPWNIQYRSATGYGCPDTAPCDAEYYGFFNQVYNAARQFRRYSIQSQLFNYRGGHNSYIQYNPNSSCGGSNVYLENAATAALYNYTPYQPNASALNNLYGSGDSCGAYGNRNFWRIHHDWFGSTFGDKPVANVDFKFENLDGGSTSVNPNANTVGINPKTISYSGELYVFYYDSTTRLLKVAIAGASGWTYQTLDGNSNANGKVIGDVGRSTTAVIYNNALHIYYYDATSRSLRHAWLSSGNSWSYETLDGKLGSVSGSAVANVGMSNTSIEFGGNMHVMYYDSTNGNLRHAQYSTSNGWAFQNLDGDFGSLARLNSDTGQNPSSAVLGSSLQLFYYDVGNGNLRHAWVNSGQPWKFENLDGDFGSIARYNGNVGQDPSVTIHGSSLQLFYYDVGNGNLRHAWVNSGQPWKFENLDGDFGSIARYNGNVGSMSEAFSFNNTLYIFYRDNAAGVLRYSWADSNGWHFAQLDGAPYSVSGNRSNTGFWPTVTGFGDTIQLYYFDNDQRALRHAFGKPFW